MSRANSTIDGEWTSTTAGGCPKHASWVHNPQYQLQPTVPDASYTLELTQLEPESSRHPIGLWVMVAASPTERVTKLSKSQTVAKTKFKVCRQVSLLVTLPPRPDGLPLVSWLIPVRQLACRGGLSHPRLQRDAWMARLPKRPVKPHGRLGRRVLA